VKQLKFFINLNEEEDYLNKMANQGWLLNKRSIFGRYHFVKNNLQKLHYKIDYRVFKNKEEFNNYVSLFEDAGFEHVWGNNHSGHQYFLPKTQNASMDIFSDKESSAQRYIRLQRNCIFWVMIMITYMMVNFIAVRFDLSELFFLTPGLWKMEGSIFWKAFWFEFPFMLMRVLPIVFFAFIAILNYSWAVKAKKIYKNIIVQEENENLCE